MPRMNSDLTKHTKEVSSLARTFPRAVFCSVREGIILLQRMITHLESPERENLLVKRDHDRFRSYMLKGKIAFTKLWFDEISTEFGYYNRFNEIQGILKNIQHAENKSGMFMLENKLIKSGMLNDRL